MDKNKMLQKLSKDLYENKGLYGANGVSGQDAMRNIFREALGIDENAGQREMYKAYELNKQHLFEIIDIAIDAVMPVIVKNQYDSLAEFHNIKIGDTIRFRNKDRGLFRVARMAAGTQDIRRQMSLSGSYTVDTDWYGVAIYTEFEQFLAGQVDWNEYISRIAESFAAHLGMQIFKAFSESYDILRATRKASGTLSLEAITELAGRLRAVSGGRQVSIYGTPAALAKVSALAELSGGMMEERNRIGYLGVISGVSLVALPEALVPGTEDFVADDNSLFFIPTGEKIVDVVMEGDTITKEIQALDDNGLQMTFRTMKKLGVNVNQAAIFGHFGIE